MSNSRTFMIAPAKLTDIDRAEAQELMISSAPLGNFPTLFRGQVTAHRILIALLLLRRRGLPPFGLAGHLWTHACMRGTVRDSFLHFKPFMFLCFVSSFFVVL